MRIIKSEKSKLQLQLQKKVEITITLRLCFTRVSTYYHRHEEGE